ncbi:DUF4147 domain-containing protein [Polyangium sp. 15x6]|uniref:DUF4147 domain-containing protein n=1 Tax=Polyangium sp. 15x6 TaxID=3042687 RepID=UPI002499E8F7|nr:DUF4147 domain-containing protein [Polyangium sp. 15x6]MDI3287683.1 DUF4147 domain-containing protein [Polyangium sp. 15x6]
MSAAEEALRRILAEVFLESLAALDPARLVAEALPPRPPEGARVRLFAAGKAAGAMARGALSRWGDCIEASLVVTVDGAPIDFRGLELRGSPVVLHAAHPVPDERSVAAAHAALAHVDGLGPDDRVLALISGGSSALLVLPPPGLDLEDERRVVRALLEGGAPIHDVNLVRRHLSRIKGGRLAAAAAPALVETLALSDVVGGALHDIGSGPTVPDPTTATEARAALARYAPAELAARLAPYLDDTTEKPFPTRTEARLLAGPEDFARAAAANLSARGFSVRIEPPEGGDARDVVEKRLAQAAALAPGNAIVVACEPTLALPAVRGRGGRAGWVALAALKKLPPGVALLCGASDGTDGSSSAAGAVVSSGAAGDFDAARIDAALAGYDDAAIHRALGTAIETGPTGQNLTDLHILARGFSES